MRVSEKEIGKKEERERKEKGERERKNRKRVREREKESEREKERERKREREREWNETSKLSSVVLDKNSTKIVWHNKKVWPKVNRLISRDLQNANLK